MEKMIICRWLMKANFTKPGEATPIVLDIGGIRFFSLPPDSQADAERMNDLLDENLKEVPA